MNIKSTLTKLFGKKQEQSLLTLTYDGQIAEARNRVNDLFAGFISMHEQLEETVASIEATKVQAIAERDRLNATIAQAEEEMNVTKVMSDNLLTFINPVAGGRKTTVLFDGDAEIKIEDQ